MKNLFFSLIAIALLVACSSKKIEEVVREGETIQPNMIRPTYTMEDYKFNDIVIDSSLKYFTKQLLADGFEIYKENFDCRRFEDELEKFNCTKFTSNEYTFLFGDDCFIYVYESIFTGKVCKVEILKEGEFENADLILNTLKEKYGKSKLILYNAEGKYDISQKFYMHESIIPELHIVRWSQDDHKEILLYWKDGASTSLEYLNPINYQEHIVNLNTYFRTLKTVDETASEVL